MYCCSQQFLDKSELSLRRTPSIDMSHEEDYLSENSISVIIWEGMPLMSRNRFALQDNIKQRAYVGLALLYP